MVLGLPADLALFYSAGQGIGLCACHIQAKTAGMAGQRLAGSDSPDVRRRADR